MSWNDSHFEDALGVYVGPATYDEVVAGWRDLRPTSELVVRIDNRRFRGEDKEVTYRHGWQEYLRVEDDEGRRDVLVVTQHEQALGYGVMYEEAPFVLAISPGELDADRFTGGVRLRSPFGTVLDIAVWHSVLHQTPSGDIAPGFRAFTAEVERREDDEEAS
jgi:hypothetical protein